MNNGAVISDNELFRYALWRIWDEGGLLVLFIGLNPSTADGEHDDPTIRRSVRFAKDWGYGGLLMGNLFAYRATQPAVLAEARDAGIDIVGSENDKYLRRMSARASLVIAAWGANASPPNPRAAQVARIVGEMECLGMTKHGAPRHPLMVPAKQQRMPYVTPAPEHLR